MRVSVDQWLGFNKSSRRLAQPSLASLDDANASRPVGYSHKFTAENQAAIDKIEDKPGRNHPDFINNIGDFRQAVHKSLMRRYSVDSFDEKEEYGS